MFGHSYFGASYFGPPYFGPQDLIVDGGVRRERTINILQRRLEHLQHEEELRRRRERIVEPQAYALDFGPTIDDALLAIAVEYVREEGLDAIDLTAADLAAIRRLRRERDDDEVLLLLH